MKKLLFALALFCSIIAMGSCDYDDSNDIDVITPHDSTQTGVNTNEKTL